MALDPSIVELVGILIGPSGAAWLAVKQSLNGTKKRVEDIQTTVNTLTTTVEGTKTRVDQIDRAMTTITLRLDAHILDVERERQ